MSLLSCTFYPTRAEYLPSEAQARRGEDVEPDPEQYQDPDNEMGLFAGTVYEADDEEADKIYEHVDRRLDERRKTKRCVTRQGSLPYVSLNLLGLFIVKPEKPKSLQSIVQNDQNYKPNLLT